MPAHHARQEFDVIQTMNALESRLEDITVPMDVSVIGCVVNGPGEALSSDVGLAGSHKKSGLYIGGQREGRLDNDYLVDTLELKIRAEAAKIAQRLNVKDLS